jgi:hypothetical protein
MNITEQDFDLLTESIMGWKGNGWEVQADRFTNGVTFDWTACYWFNTPSNMILARTFLENNGHTFQQSYDENMGYYILLTNYDCHNMAVSA